MKQNPRERKRYTTERLPLSNLKYTRGSIIYAEFSQTGEFYMHNRRPLVVIGMPIGFYGKVICCTTTSRNVPGIIAHFYRDDGLEIGGYPVSTIVPYNILPVDVSQIINTIGQLNPWIFQKVDNAVAFHLGYSDEYPEYCAPGTGFYEEHLEVKYSYGKDYEEPCRAKMEARPHMMFSSRTVQAPTLLDIEEPEPEIAPAVQIQPSRMEEHAPVSKTTIEEKEVTQTTKIQPRTLRRPRRPYTKQSELMSMLTDEEKYQLLIEPKLDSEFANTLGLTRPAVSRLRSVLIQDATNDFAVSRIKSLLHGTVSNFGLLSNIDRAAITYFLPRTVLDLSQKNIQDLERRILLYINQSETKPRKDRIHPESFYCRLTNGSHRSDVVL